MFTFLALSPVVAEVDGETGLAAVVFRLTGVDADVTGFEVSIDAGESFLPATASADGPGAYLLTIDLSSYDGAPEGIAVVRVTDTAGNNASAEGTVAITYPEEPGFPLEVQAEAFTVIDTVGTTGAALTQARVPGNIEGTVPVRDVNGDGLWDGFTGAGYMDMGGNSGDAVQFTVDAPSAGTYTLAFRYSNGGTTARPMTLSVNGTSTATPQFASTGSNAWDNWQTESLNVTLAAGTNTIRLAQNQGSGPNFDKVTVFPDTTADF